MDYIEHATAVSALAGLKVLAKGIMAEAKLMDNMVIGCQVLEGCLDQSGEIAPDDFMEQLAEGDLALNTIIKLAKKALEDMRALSEIARD